MLTLSFYAVFSPQLFQVGGKGKGKSGKEEEGVVQFGRTASTDVRIDLGWHAAERSGTQNAQTPETTSILQPATVVACAI